MIGNSVSNVFLVGVVVYFIVSILSASHVSNPE